MTLDTMVTMLSRQLKDEVIEELRNENIAKLDQRTLSPIISQHQLAKEIRKSDKWVHDRVLFNPQYSAELQAMIDSGAMQLKGAGNRTQTWVNREAISQFLRKHSNELPWSESV